MKFYVLDASAVLTFLLGKNPSVVRKFKSILSEIKNDKAKLYSTHLLPLEVGNGLRFSLADEELAKETFRKFFNLPIELLIFSSPQLAKVLELSFHLKISFYDTSYHFLAKLMDGTFVTCDAKYFRKAKDLGNVKLL